ncbi:energy transducer TonB [Marinoscillum sp. MHG1-6]|uniref:energy transducer TonB n=1 Tax=Marinoscillum sp. MHG1-6 TaxID=2959627 RepID=UPI00215870AC|nr:energy transducer TonB [Marinoscillum sp. MHG1-6]
MELKKNKSVDLERRSPLHFFIGLVIAMSLVLVAFEWKSEIDPLEIGPPLDPYEEPYYPPITKIKPPEAPKPVEKPKIDIPKPSPTPNFTESETPEPKDTKSVDVEPVDIIGDPPIFAGPPVEEPDFYEGIVESKPEFSGGMPAFYEYIAQNLKYPRKAINQDVQGKVFIRFVIDTTGAITNIEVVKGIGFGCDEAAKAVLQNAPKFKPAKQRGRPVRFRQTIPINFRLN